MMATRQGKTMGHNAENQSSPLIQAGFLLFGFAPGTIRNILVIRPFTNWPNACARMLPNG